MVTCEILRRCRRPPVRASSPTCEGDGSNSSSGRGSCFCPGGSVCAPGKGCRAVSLVAASVARSPCWAAEAGSRLQDGTVCRPTDGCDAILFCLCLCAPLGWRSAVRLTRGIVVALPALIRTRRLCGGTRCQHVAPPRRRKQGRLTGGFAASRAVSGAGPSVGARPPASAAAAGPLGMPAAAAAAAPVLARASCHTSSWHRHQLLYQEPHGGKNPILAESQPV